MTAEQAIAISVIENRTVCIDAYDTAAYDELALRCADDCDPHENAFVRGSDDAEYLVFWGAEEGHEWRVLLRDEVPQ
jgi:hypothetical protein